MGFEWIHEETTKAQEKKLTIKVPARKPAAAAGEEEQGGAEVGGDPALASQFAKLLDITQSGLDVDSNLVLAHPTGNIKEFYTMGKELGRGHFGVVRVCEEILTGVQYASKSIMKANLKKKEEIKELQAEIGVMQHLAGHTNIVQLRDVFEDDEAVHLVMELCKEGDLFDYIARKRRLPEPEAARVFRQVVLAVQYCHSRGVIHRDLKPENILFAKLPQEGNQGEHPVVKLADFGLAVVVQPGEMASGLAGSPFYMAPELVRRKKYSTEIDIWSLGVVLYTAVSGFLPFWGKTHEQTFAAVCRGEPDFVKKPWQMISPEAKSLIRKMLTMDPSKRATIDDILNHPWTLTHCPKDAQTAKPKPLVGGGIFSFPAAPMSPRDTDPSRHAVQQALSAPKGQFSLPRNPSPVSSPRAMPAKPSISQFLPTPPGTPKKGEYSVTPFAAALTKPFRMLQQRREDAAAAANTSPKSPQLAPSPVAEVQTTPRPFFLSEPQRAESSKRELILQRPLEGGARAGDTIVNTSALQSTGLNGLPQIKVASPRSPLERPALVAGGKSQC